jgi:HSP20 family protein
MPARKRQAGGEAPVAGILASLIARWPGRWCLGERRIAMEEQKQQGRSQGEAQDGRKAEREEAKRREATTGSTAEGAAERSAGLARESVREGVTALGRGMSHAARTPFDMMRRFFEDADRMFEAFSLGANRLAPRGLAEDWQAGLGAMPGWAPQLEVEQQGDELVVRADLPGMKKDDVQVELEKGLLTIRGERREERRDEREGFFRSERSYGRFERSLRLPESVDPSRCDARFEDGVLEVRMRLPEGQEGGRKQIPIRASREEGSGSMESSRPIGGSSGSSGGQHQSS